MVRDFDRQGAEFQVRVAVLNGLTALGILVTKVVGSICPGDGAVRPSASLCTEACQRCAKPVMVSFAAARDRSLRACKRNR